MLLKNSSYNVIANILCSAIALMQSIFIARYFGPETLGILVASQALVLTLRSFIGFRLDEAAAYYINRLNIKSQKTDIIKIIRVIFTIEFITITFTSFLSAASFFLLAIYAPEKNYNFLVVFLSSILLFTTTLDIVFTSIARYQNRYKLLFMCDTLIAIFSIIVIGSIYLVNHLNIFTYLIALIIIGVLKFVFYINFLKKNIEMNVLFDFVSICGLFNFPQRKNTIIDHNSLFKFIRGGYVSSSLSQLCKNSPFFLLGLIGTPEMIGHFRVALNLASVGNYLITPFSNVLFQWLNKFHHNIDIIKFYFSYKFYILLWFLLVLLATSIVMFYANSLITIFYGLSYSPSILIFTILLIGISLNTSLFWVRPIALVAGQSAKVYSITTYISLLQLCIIYPCSIYFGVSGIAASLSFAWAAGPLFFAIISIKSALTKKHKL
jgi:O-antigen/teichoic acid export membrane protein